MHQPQPALISQRPKKFLFAKSCATLNKAPATTVLFWSYHSIADRRVDLWTFSVVFCSQTAEHVMMLTVTTVHTSTVDVLACQKCAVPRNPEFCNTHEFETVRSFENAPVQSQNPTVYSIKLNSSHQAVVGTVSGRSSMNKMRPACLSDEMLVD